MIRYSPTPPDPPVISASSLTEQEVMGKGLRATVWRCRWQGETAVLKIYSPETDRKYRRRTGMTMARYEFSQNARAAAHPPLRHHVARPLAIVAAAGDGLPCEAFLQQHVPGELLSQMRRRAPIGEDLLQSARLIVREMHRAGMWDFDFHASNLLVRDGRTLTLFDFNILPRHLYFHNPLTWLGFKLGVVDPRERDLRSLDRLIHRARQAAADHSDRQAA